jgi:hypothetical protein
VHSEIEEFLSSNARAKAALELLSNQGCDRSYILRSAYLFCGLDPDELARLDRELQYRKKKAKETVNLLRTLCDDIDQVSEWLAEAECCIHTAPDRRALRSYANALEGTWTVLPPIKRLSGRDHHFVNLMEHVESRTGKKLWAQITNLIEGIAILYKNENFKDLSEAALRKRYKNHRGKEQMAKLLVLAQL